MCHGALNDILVFLRAHDEESLARYVSHVMELRRKVTVISSGMQFGAPRFWGGAGSIGDRFFTAEDGIHPSEENRRLRRAMVRLGERLEAAGLADDTIRERVRIFRGSGI